MIVVTSPAQIDLRGDFVLVRRVQHEVALLSQPGVITADQVVQGEAGVVGIGQESTPTTFEVLRAGPAAVAAGVMVGDTVLVDATYCRVRMGNEIQVITIGREKCGVLPLKAICGWVRDSSAVQ
jgi:hypothetical protein